MMGAVTAGWAMTHATARDHVHAGLLRQLAQSIDGVELALVPVPVW